MNNCVEAVSFIGCFRPLAFSIPVFQVDWNPRLDVLCSTLPIRPSSEIVPPDPWVVSWRGDAWIRACRVSSLHWHHFPGAVSEAPLSSY